MWFLFQIKGIPPTPAHHIPIPTPALRFPPVFTYSILSHTNKSIYGRSWTSDEEFLNNNLQSQDDAPHATTVS